MNYGRFFIPGINMNHMMGMNPNFYMNPQNFISRTISSIRSFNWRGLLNGANKTINVVNQTIPLVRQAKPMFNNMKSMIKLVRSFGKETYVNNKIVNANKIPEKKEVINNDYPNFFI